MDERQKTLKYLADAGIDVSANKSAARYCIFPLRA